MSSTHAVAASSPCNTWRI